MNFSERRKKRCAELRADEFNIFNRGNDLVFNDGTVYDMAFIQADDELRKAYEDSGISRMCGSSASSYAEEVQKVENSRPRAYYVQPADTEFSVPMGSAMIPWSSLSEAQRESFIKEINGEQQEFFTSISGAEGFNATGESILTECTHQWETYIGLLQQFDYCKHCDIKRTT